MNAVIQGSEIFGILFIVLCVSICFGIAADGFEAMKVRSRAFWFGTLLCLPLCILICALV